MSAFIRFFVNRHLMVNVLAAAVVVLAFYTVGSLPREFIPSVDMPQLTIRAMLPGASARDMETKITIPIEEAIETVDGVDEYSTTISDSVSVTTVDLYIDSSKEQVETAIQDLRDAIDGITDFPPEMEDEPLITQFNPGKWAIVEVALSGDLETLTPLAEMLERRIERLPSVSRVTIVGLQDPEVRILIDPAKARAHGITVIDVINAVERRNVSSTGATLETATDRKQVIVWSRYEDPTDVGETIITTTPTLGLVRINDIARIELAREDTGLITHTDAKPGLSLVVFKRENADALDAAEEVRELMGGLDLPEDVGVSYVNDRSFYVSNRLEVMTTNGILGSFLVAGVLFLFMRKDAAIWVVVGIPVVFCGAVALFAPFAMTLNLFTLTGLVIVLGMVVDDAVVVAENVVAKRAQGLGPHEAAIVGAKEMVRPVCAAAMTTMLAFGPMLAMGGLPGKLFWMLPLAVLLVLLFSLLESFCVLPAHMSSISSTSSAEKREFVQVLEDHYRRALNWCFAHRAVVLLIAAGIFLFIMIVLRPFVPFVQFPQDDARMLFMKISTPLGTPLEQTEALATDLQQQVRDITAPDFVTVTARIGHQDVLSRDKERGEAENEALLIVMFSDFDRAKSNVQWIQTLKEDLDTPPGVEITMQSDYVGPPTDEPVTVHVLANDDELRRAVAREVADFVAASEGTTELQIDERLGTPKLDLNLNYEKLALLGLDPATVSLTVQASFFGIEASEHRDMDHTTELRVMFDPSARGDLNAFLDTPIRTPDGRLVSLRDVVNPIETPGLDRIFHRESFRSATVRASFTPDAPHTALSYATVLEEELLPRYADVPGLELHIGGEAKDTQESTSEIGGAAVLAILAIAVVIWIILGSLVEAVFVIVVIPFAIAGVILAFFLHGLDLSMTAMIGAVGLCGVVVNASIVMIDAIHRMLAESQGDREPREVVTDAIVSRLRPILVTTLTTLGGVLPTAYGIGGYDIIVSPMSVAIGWGLTLSTGVTLFVVPVLYSIAQDINQRVAPTRYAQQTAAETA